MIKLSKLTDYTIVVLQCFAENSACLQSVSNISEATTIPEPTVAKVLKQLKNGGILTSVQGARGGYLLAKPLQSLSVLDIVELVEGPVKLVDCVVADNSQCTIQSNCSLGSRWLYVNEVVRESLAGIDVLSLMQTDSIYPIKFRDIDNKNRDIAEQL